MIFVILGSQKFQFNRLLKKVDELVEQGVITEEVFAQTGYSDYIPQHYSFKQFLNREEFAEMEAKADIVITHGGTGAIMGAIKKGKKVIAVPRLAKYGEHVDDHQVQLLKQFGDIGLIEVSYDTEMLAGAYEKSKVTEYVQYTSNTTNVINSIDDFISSYSCKKSD